MINADSHFTIGAGHVICQDYCLHGLTEQGAYVIGADGCSSSPKSELGARILCELTRKTIELNGGMRGLEQFRAVMIQEMQQVRAQLRLDLNNFDATLWLAMMNGSDYMIFGWGDGVVRKTYDDGSVDITKVEFTSNAPRYISYALSASRYASYLEQTKDSKVIETNYYRAANGEVSISDSEKEVDGYSFLDTCEIGGGGRVLTSISIMSDGVNTFKHKDADTCLDVFSMANDVCDFVKTKGRFVERQMQWLLKQNQKADIIHVDDLFCGSIHHTPNKISTEEIIKILEDGE